MKCVTISRGASFNFDYFLNPHIPWARQLVPDSGTEIRRGTSAATGGPVPYRCLCRFWFNAEEDYRAAMAKHGAELMADITNFTNVKPIVQVDEVLLDTEVEAAA
jgi:uncharacterized protein (TIGR02118 family)